MNWYRHSLFIVLSLLSVVLVRAEEEATPVRLGAVFNLTGELAVLDQTSLQGAQLAAKHASAMGQPVELVLINGESDAGLIKEKVTAFFEEHPDSPAILGISGSDLARAAGQAAAGQERTYLTSGATSPKLPDDVPVYLYLACFGDNVQAAAAAQWAYENQGARKVAVVYNPDHTYTRLLHQYFQEAFKKHGGEIVSVTPIVAETYGIDTDSIAEADLIFLASEATNGTVKAVRTLREAGFTQPILGGDGYDTPSVWAKNADTGGDIYYTTHAYIAPDNPNPVVKAFYQAYVLEFNGLKPDSFSALGYDATGMLVDAVKRAGSTDSVAVREALGQTKDYPGVTGTITYVGGSHIPLKPVAILAVNDGQVSFVEEVLPKQVPKP